MRFLFPFRWGSAPESPPPLTPGQGAALLLAVLLGEKHMDELHRAWKRVP